MAVKITEKALREFVRNMLLEQQEGDDSAGEETNPPAVSTFALDKPDVPLDADPHVVDNTLGPPTADPGYLPEDAGELKAAVGKLLDDVPDSSVGTAYKIVKKTLDNLHSVLRQRAEINPLARMNMSESSSVEKLLLLISEQGFPGIRVVDAPKSDAAAAGFGDEEEDEPDPELEKMIGAQITSAQAEKMRKDQATSDASQEKIDKEQGVVSQTLSDKSIQKRIDLAKEMFPEKAGRIDKAISQEEDLDTVLSFDELESVQEELEITDVFAQSMQAGTAKFSEMSDELKSRYADVFLGGGEPMKSSVFRNLQDSAFMKFMMGLAIGPDFFDEKFVEFMISPPEDARKIRSFLKKHTDVARIMANPTAGGVEKVLDQLREKSPEGELIGQYKHLVSLYLANDIGFPGAKSSKFHFNKEVGNEALKKAVEGLIRRQEKKAYDNLVQLLNDPKNKKAVTGHLGKAWKIDSWQSKEEEEVEDVISTPDPEPQKSVTRSPRGKTFRRKRSEAELAENITPAEAILRSSAVNPDLDKALALVKGIV